ncbi:PTS system mannose/fructose/sorbose family transporter subunit IID [Clostridium fungisolvens]|uniref:PTS system mannose-specific EIID component n=1 Tax=Clostridium fungisolvens TaxID=1604897 RepID=A0A6V8SMN7_9CLOT|nr:PTS system mannose/fructose/sorbose family transporter subunit IID [Clostridium fungisolvens]GFP76438.1 PTS system mannose-specific EIID component [Clostridium fungisolvens]
MDKKVLSQDEKKILKSMFLRSHLVFATFNMVKMEANGLTLTMQPAIEAIYKNDPEGKKEAYLRHQSFFNTHAVPFSFIAGLTYAMEREHKENNSIDGKTIDSIKAALMGPTAGMFDSLFFNCLRIIAAGIGIGLCSQGSILGMFIFILLYGVSQSVVKYLFINWGYTVGTSFIDSVYNSGLMNCLTKAASVLGLTMVGAMTAQMVDVPFKWTLSIGKTSVVIQDVINSIFPGLLGLILLFVLVKLIKKGARPTQLILGIFVLAMVGAFLGVFW